LNIPLEVLYSAYTSWLEKISVAGRPLDESGPLDPEFYSQIKIQKDPCIQTLDKHMYLNSVS
jgi:hypothetical protein